MSVWRKKAIECLPDLKKEFEHPETSIYIVFSEMLHAVIQAHKEKDIVKLKKIYDYAEWCSKQKNKDLWNAAGVAFYEHLGDREETLQEFRLWVKPEIYVNIRGLMEWRLEKSELKKLDKLYGFNSKIK